MLIVLRSNPSRRTTRRTCSSPGFALAGNSVGGCAGFVEGGTIIGPGAGAIGCDLSMADLSTGCAVLVVGMFAGGRLAGGSCATWEVVCRCGLGSSRGGGVTSGAD